MTTTDQGCPHDDGTCITAAVCAARTARGREPEHVTGYFLRIPRGGKWQVVDVARMTDDELRTHFEREDNAVRLRHWVVSLATWIRVQTVLGPEK